MGVALNPYLNFRGQAREAMDFYRSVLGGELTSTTFAEGGMQVAPEEQDQLMHAQFEVDGMTLMGADVPSGWPAEISNGSISLSGDDEATLRRYWAGLADGATVTAPLEKAPWGDTFGMLTDRYGVNWLVNIAGQPT